MPSLLPSLVTSPTELVSTAERVSPAEQRVLEHLRQGLSNKAIAAVLVLSHRTVESHVSSLLAKTGCGNRSQLLLWALGER
ncbi:helix-turn-helix transcriptional regulator [Synechococcus sp. CS-602]|uniref:response regulator transcription factor n=1 Tax=Synechococcaceae TaxID=1890426 RepID=UPI00090C2433|nr:MULTISPECIES: helix-turn-helix transcriptional regulator [Synechococcaceae]MCT0247018.1 helix-turn-helix transcriptional regulator [Synechococcus sp. CS-601]MCT4365926.1 helix-turn-helix transcriptional regulator [Candidatus Regnicoccus frigidus MAG-AL1]APD48377.1 helix-turn-helix transcriptional regulator [Synechococcus sp. SynAce01]MCT0201715.1 helix-turn-helix transcriptional regulator [Synechococcus sp. CS-603]MCT0205657.1 helix-turn-helix transcriptional regulator [Synechococcus sp. CS